MGSCMTSSRCLPRCAPRASISVTISDLTPDPTGAGKDELALGVNPGWEAYGGIIWSPEQPGLYELRARLRTEHGEDVWFCRTGFREVVTRGPDFLLNGQRLVLNRVSRHDMWSHAD